MTDPLHFVAPSRSEIFDALGASVFYVLSDMPWSFSVVAPSGEKVSVWVAELPDKVDVSVSVQAADVVTFTSFRGGASRLAVSAQPPEIVIESESDDRYARLEISLAPRLLIKDMLDRRGPAEELLSPAMTTLYGSKRDLTISLGFIVLVVGAMSASTLIRGSTILGLVFLFLAVGLIVLTIVLRRLPPNELRVSSDVIELTRPRKTIGSLSHADTGGRIDVRRHVYRGRAFWSVVPAGGEPGSGFSVDDFVPEEIRSAAQQHGWTVDIVQ